jgi:dihydrolipoamide dehydrogenase
MPTYDLTIIGGGPAGYLAAERAAQGGLSVLLFEKRELGGVCLNEGCIPTKTLLHSAKLYEQAKNGGAFGVFGENFAYNHETVVARKNKVVKKLTSGVASVMKRHKVEVVKETAVITGKTAEGFSVSAGGSIYEAKRLLVAAGSEPIVPPIPGLKEGLASGFVKTSREILDMVALPKSLTVIGGGVIGLEMATYFATAGVSVTVVEMANHIGGYTDGEIAQILLDELKGKGVKFKLGCKVTEIGANSVSYQGQDGVSASLETETVLLSIGRRPCSQGLGLETIGVFTERGAVVTDNHLRTNVPGVYAAGDINGKSLLAHTAYREAEVAVNHMLGKRDTMRYDAIPSVIYTAPEVAGVGETEETAAEKGLAFTVKKLPLAYAGRFVAENEKTGGLCKILVEKGSERVLGVHMVGGIASEIIYGAAMMVESRWPLADLQKMVFPHPTVGEILREVMFV